MTTDRSHAGHLYPMSELAKPNGFGDICKKKLLSDPYVLFLKMVAMFLMDQKSKHNFCARYPKEHSYKIWFQLIK